MASSYKVLSSDEIEEEISFVDEFAKDTFLGFNKTPKSMNSRYLYDTAGSKIYEQIMELPEYYLVKSELEILEKYKTSFAEFIGPNMDVNLVELGAGNGYKTVLLLEAFLKRSINLFHYHGFYIHKFLYSMLGKFAAETTFLNSAKW